jgi:serine/threonine protein kinase
MLWSAVNKKYSLSPQPFASGSYGKVYIAKNVHTKKPYVAKVVEKKGTDRWTSEIECLQILKDCDGVVSLHDVYQSDKAVVMVMDKMTPFFPSEDEYDVRESVREILLALSDIHDHGVIHGDVKPGNVMKGDDDSCKFIDFGLSTRFSDENKPVILKDPCGSPGYASPEVYNKTTSPKSDVWSTGVVAYNFMTGDLPFPGSTPCKVMHHILYTNPTTGRILDFGYSIHAANFVLDLLAKKPSDRPSVKEALAHSWFSTYIPKSFDYSHV